MTNTLELCSICKSYDQFKAVDNLSFAIRPGTVYGLLGPNGAGKTSTLRTMIGITLPDSGEVRLFGEHFRREHLARIGYLPEERGLYKRMHILELLVFLAELKGVERMEAAKRAMWWLERLELGRWAKSKVEELSKGMQQKVQFIAAVLHQPEFVIMDEPFSGLDPANAMDLKNILLELKQAGKTILFSTHRMDQVERLCDSICLVNRGKSVLEGELKQIKAGYGRSSVQMEYDGAAPFLERSDLVQSFNNYGNFVELRLQPGADSQQLLEIAMKTARVNRFELVEPSLEEIFIDVVGKDVVVKDA
ncbi:MAG TPA: ATP-binding cassette domain-containing protein [Clostridia bacterium]|nr:ATP-binding cassette domain-containing protein [Clostridia bacterium]